MTKPVKYCPNCGYGGDNLDVFEGVLEGLTISRFDCPNCDATGEAYIG